MEPASLPTIPDFRLGDCLVRPQLNRIDGPDGPVQVEPRVMDVLVYLAGRPGRVVSKEELVREVWEGRFVSDDVVWRSVGELRRALGDNGRQVLQTVARRGYRLILPEEPPPAADAAPAAPPSSPAPRRLAVALVVLSMVGVAMMQVFRARPGEPPGLAAASPAAQDALVRGRYLLQRGTPEAVRASLPHLERATALDPSSAAAWAGLADARHLLALTGALPPGEAYPMAEAAARRALELDPTLADTRATLGSILFRHHWDWQGAEAELRRAVEADPRSAVAHHDYAWLLVALGRFDEGLREMKETQVIDPLSLRANADVGWALYRARRYGEAIEHMRRLLDLEPGFEAARHCLERALVHEGRLAEAVELARAGLARRGLGEAEIDDLTRGEPAGALRRIARWRLGRLEERARNGYASPYARAVLHAELGERDRALALLEAAFAGRDPSLASAAVDPMLDPLRQEPRLREILRRMGLAPSPRPSPARGEGATARP